MRDPASGGATPSRSENRGGVSFLLAGLIFATISASPRWRRTGAQLVPDYAIARGDALRDALTHRPSRHATAATSF